MLNFKSFINHSPIIIFIWNPIPNQPVLYVSENISQFGYTQEDFLSEKVVYSDLVHPDDLPKIRAESQKHIKDGVKSFLQKYRIITKSGELRWVFDHTWDELDPNGNTLYYYGFILDITDQIEIEQALRESEERFRIAAQNVSDIIFEYNVPDHHFIWFGELEKLLKISKDEIPRRFTTLSKYIHPDDIERIENEVENVIKSKDHSFFKCRVIPADKKERYWEGSVEVIRNESGSPLKLIGVLNDVSEKYAIEQALRDSEERFRIVAENSSDLIYEYDFDETNLAWFGDVETFYGIDSNDIPKSFDDVISYIHPSDQEKIRNQVNETVISTKARMVYEYRILKKDREIRFIRDVARIIRGGNGKPIKVIGALSDITERHKFERILQQSEARFRAVAENSSDLIYEYDYTEKAVKIFGDLESFLGFSEKELNKYPKKFYDLIPDEDRIPIEKEMVNFLASREDKKNFEYRLTRKDGELIYCHDNTKIIRDPRGFPQKAICALSNITEKHRYEEALRLSEERFRIAAQMISDLIFEYDIEKHSVIWFGDVKKVLKINSDQIPTRMTEFFNFIHPDDRERVIKESKAALKFTRADFDYRIIRGDGKTRIWHSTVQIIRNSSSIPIKIIGAMADLTHQKNIEAELEIRQRMDYIGNFAAGIAHDFNNILAVILGNISLLQMDSEHLSEEHNQIINDVSIA
ncbi:MAG: PAS domain-containing protein, partial [Promethearchaeota archaeon]